MVRAVEEVRRSPAETRRIEQGLETVLWTLAKRIKQERKRGYELSPLIGDRWRMWRSCWIVRGRGGRH